MLSLMRSSLTRTNAHSEILQWNWSGVVEVLLVFTIGVETLGERVNEWNHNTGLMNFYWKGTDDM